jgi:Zn-dependent protease
LCSREKALTGESACPTSLEAQGTDVELFNSAGHEIMIVVTLAACSDCGAPIQESALSCPSCHALTHAKELESLAAQAQQAMARGDVAAAREFWERSASLLPPDTVQYRAIRAHIDNLKNTQQQPDHKWWKKGAAGIGPALLLLFTKGKLLLLGLTKLSTLLSMLAFAGVYWALYGWTFAVGMVFSIYIHEMGHVLMLRQYGIPASAPMFIPGFGAFIRLKQLRLTPIQDNSVGLAGPIYGLGAAAFALAAGYVTGAKAWDAIAHFGAIMNLFNLVPVWQLDGGRGFASQTRQQRMVILGVAGVLWWLTGEVMLGLITIGAVYRLFTKDAPAEPDKAGMQAFIGLLAALSVIAMLAQRHAQ